MYSYDHFIRVRCVGALIRKPHVWPPHPTDMFSAAEILSQRSSWQPRTWYTTTAQHVRVRTAGQQTIQEEVETETGKST